MLDHARANALLQREDDADQEMLREYQEHPCQFRDGALCRVPGVAVAICYAPDSCGRSDVASEE